MLFLEVFEQKLAEIDHFLVSSLKGVRSLIMFLHSNLKILKQDYVSGLALAVFCTCSIVYTYTIVILIVKCINNERKKEKERNIASCPLM